jgi:hypothetical protein
MLSRKSKESPLDRLEREANDDFLLLAELGPEYFGAEHLLELREQMHLRMAQFDRWRKLNTLVGATSVGWLAMGGLAAMLGWPILTGLALGIMGLSLLGFIVGVWLLKWKYESRGELEYTLLSIEEELRRRAALRGRSAQL